MHELFWEKERLRYFKYHSIFYNSIFAIYIFANSIMPQACFCVADCQDNIQSINTKRRIQFHNRCSVGQCESCDIEDAQAVKAFSSSSPNFEIEPFCTTSKVICPPDFQPAKNSIHICYNLISKFAIATYLKYSAFLL